MTLIVAVRDKGSVVVGEDSCTSDGWATSTAATPKVFRGDGFLVGFSDSWRFGQILETKLILAPPARRQSHESWAVQNLVPKMRAALKDAGHAKIENAQERGDGTILVATPTTILLVQSDFSVIRHLRDFDAVGSGYLVAYGALEATRGADAEVRVRRALRVASKFVATVLPPFRIHRISK